MSKNIVDAVCAAAEQKNVSFGLIPSRRQVEDEGGYVNGWRTEEFVRYVREQNSNIVLQRDHGGPAQGQLPDDGKVSAAVDCRAGFDLFHVDPWKQYPRIEDAARVTVEFIRYCILYNDTLEYEIGTEAAIREYSLEEFLTFLILVEKGLGTDFRKVKYATVQGGTNLLGNKNIGLFNKDRCLGMIEICKEFGLLSKEHNGDYLSVPELRQRFDLGLDAINIAPEFGFMETQVILNEMFNNLDHHSYNKFYHLCLSSKKWVKWLPPEISQAPPDMKKMAILRTAGHYVFSAPEFQEIKTLYPDVDDKIREVLTAKITQLLQVVDA